MFCVFAMSISVQANQNDPELNVIYGDNHIFTVETPTGWINDKTTASSIGLVSLFVPKADSGKEKRSYFYAMGYDKPSSEKTMKDFIEGDLKKFKKKYPKLTYKITKLKASGAILNAVLYSFDNLDDRYKEEVVYMETKYSVFVFPFTVYSIQEYSNYQPVFDKFINSFHYRGNNPKQFLDWQKKNQ